MAILLLYGQLLSGRLLVHNLHKETISLSTHFQGQGTQEVGARVVLTTLGDVGLVGHNNKHQVGVGTGVVNKLLEVVVLVGLGEELVVVQEDRVFESPWFFG